MPFAPSSARTTCRPRGYERFLFCAVVKQHVRKFVASHPSHRLVELDVEDPTTQTALAHNFGMHPSCWGKRNVNLDISSVPDH
jgi:hypothetical protein